MNSLPRALYDRRSPASIVSNRSTINTGTSGVSFADGLSFRRPGDTKIFARLPWSVRTITKAARSPRRATGSASSSRTVKLEWICARAIDQLEERRAFEPAEFIATCRRLSIQTNHHRANGRQRDAVGTTARQRVRSQ